MGRKKHTEEQVISILREAKAGTKVQNLCRRYGASDDTYYHDLTPKPTPHTILSAWSPDRT